MNESLTLVVDPMRAVWAQLAGFVPKFAAAVVILVAGYLIAKLAQRLVSGLLRRLKVDDACKRVGLTAVLERAEITRSATDILGRILFWLILIAFLIPTTESLGLQQVSGTIDSLVAYLPNVLGAALIVVIGLVVAHFIKNLVRSGAESIQFEYAEAVSRMAYGILIVIVVTLAIGQLKIETALLNRVVEIVLIAAGAAIALAVGLGSRNIAGNLMAGMYVRNQFRSGATLKVGDLQGTLEQIGTVSTRLKLAKGEVHVPNSQLLEAVVHSQD